MISKRMNYHKLKKMIGQKKWRCKIKMIYLALFKDKIWRRNLITMMMGLEISEISMSQPKNKQIYRHLKDSQIFRQMNQLLKMHHMKAIKKRIHSKMRIMKMVLVNLEILEILKNLNLNRRKNNLKFKMKLKNRNRSESSKDKKKQQSLKGRKKLRNQ